MLRYRADLRTIGFVLFYAFLVALPFSVPSLNVFRGGSLVLGGVLLCVTCVFSFLGAVATHNTIHSPVFKNRTANRVFQVALTLTYGHPVSAFVPGHNLSHHKHTQTARDVMRTSKTRFRWNLLNGLFFAAMVGPAIMRGESRYFSAMKERLPTWFQQYRIEKYTLWAIYGVLLWVDWRVFLLHVFLPHKYAAWGIITMNLLQHDGCDENSKYNHSRNFVGTLVNWFTFNNGYHSIHHDEPGLHWSLCPAAHRELIAPHIDPALCQKSLLGYLFKTYVFPGKRLTFRGEPVVLPDFADEEWVPRPETTKEDLGAIAPA